LRNVVVAHAKYNISLRNYPGSIEQKLSSAEVITRIQVYLFDQSGALKG
jgi:hypothetical protein